MTADRSMMKATDMVDLASISKRQHVDVTSSEPMKSATLSVVAQLVWNRQELVRNLHEIDEELARNWHKIDEELAWNR